MSTASFSAKDIKRKWHHIDAQGKVLGRLATEVARLLMGKHKPEYVPFLDLGDFVVITNAAKVKVTGKKREQKKYITHSGYPGGLKSETFKQLNTRIPTRIVEHAIEGMLPKNKLGRKMIKKLKVFADETNPYAKLTEEDKNGGK